MRKLTRLYPVDKDDPCSFRMLVRGYPIDVWFSPSADGRPSLALGVLNLELFKSTSLRRVRTWVRALGAVTGASSMAALVRRVRRRSEHE